MGAVDHRDDPAIPAVSPRQFQRPGRFGNASRLGVERCFQRRRLPSLSVAEQRQHSAGHACGRFDRLFGTVACGQFEPLVFDRSLQLRRIELCSLVACLYRVKDFAEALKMANDSFYGLTACIHTSNVHRAIQFTQEVQAGVAVVNGGTYGSEPHMPFGGLKQSGNGWREPGTEALDVYSELKDIYINYDPAET